MNNDSDTKNSSRTAKRLKAGNDAFGVGFHDGGCFFPVPLHWAFTGRCAGNFPELHARFLYPGTVSLHDEALSGSLRKKKGCINLKDFKNMICKYSSPLRT